MEKAALILEGGGFRGLYTSGVLDCFMERGLYLSDVYGVSAGACNAVNYAAKEVGRTADINFHFCNDKRYVSYRNLVKYHSAFNMEFLFDEVPEEYAAFDYQTFFHSDVTTHIGATNLLTGKCDFFTQQQMDRKMFPVRASCALPLFSHIFYLNGTPYLDGGIANPIPISRAINDGHRKNIVVLTQHPEFVKKPTSTMRLIRRVYQDYPQFIHAEEIRHKIYNRQRRVCAILAKTRQAFILQPKEPVRVKSMEASETRLRELYQWGYDDASANLDRIAAFLRNDV